MESVTGQPSVWAALIGGWTRGDLFGLGLAMITIAVLAIADFVLGVSAVLVGAMVVAPFVCSLFARATVTLLAGGLALAIAAVIEEWNMNFGEPGYWIGLGIIAGGTLFAALSARNRERSRLQSQRLRILDAVGAIADGSRPLDETLSRVTELVVPQAADFCMVDAVHAGRATRAAVRVATHPRADAIEDWLRNRDPTLPEWLITPVKAWRQIPRWRPRVREEELRRMAHSPEDFEFLLSLGVSSFVIVPIASRGRNLGVLTLVSAWSRRRYSEDDVRFAQILASRTGLALDNAGLFSDLESVERRMDSVMAILDEAVVIHGRDGGLVYANPAAARTMGFDSPDELISTPTERIRERFVIRDEAGRSLGPEAFAGGRAIADGRASTLILRATDRESGREHWYRTKARSIPGPDGDPLYSVTAIEDVSDVKRAEFEQALLARTGELLASSTDYRETLEAVAALVVPEFADWCGVRIPRDDGLIEQVAVAHSDPDRVRAARELSASYPTRTDDAAGVAEVLRTGEPQLVASPEELLRRVAKDEEHLRLLRDAGVGSVMIVPMSVGGEILGALGLVNEPDSRTFDSEDLGLAVELGRRAGLALENARLAGERARVTEALQRELLPPDLPAMPGWEVATMYRPAGEVNEVGGDFYEAFEVDGGWALVLGDVSGHGASAASITALARHTIRTATMISGDPAVGFRVLDQRLRERDAVALCSVAVVMIPDTSATECEARLWLAGHPLPFRLRAGAVEEVGEPGPLAGIGEEIGWRPQPVGVRAGDQLVVYTDGVTEARASGGERFGRDRLRARLASCDDPRVAVGEVEAALSRFAPGEPEDDAALVVIRRLPAVDPDGSENAADVPAGAVRA